MKLVLFIALLLAVVSCNCPYDIRGDKTVKYSACSKYNINTHQACYDSAPPTIDTFRLEKLRACEEQFEQYHAHCENVYANNASCDDAPSWEAALAQAANHTRPKVVLTNPQAV